MAKQRIKEQASHAEDCVFHNDKSRCSCGFLTVMSANEENDKSGRPTKYSTARHQKIIDNLKQGCTRVAAANAAGICYDTFRTWLQAFPVFSAAVEKAEADYELTLNKTITKSAKKNFAAATWWLERRRRKDYALRAEITGADGEPLVPDHVAEAMARAGKFATPKKKK